MKTMVGFHISRGTCGHLRSEAYFPYSGFTEQHKLDTARRLRCIGRRICHRGCRRVKQLKFNP